MDMKEVELVWLLMISVFTLLFKWNSALNKLYIDADGRGGRRFTCVGRCEWGRGGGWAAGDSGCFDWMYWGLSNTSVWVAQAVAGLLFTSRYWSSVAEMLYQTYAVCFVSGVFFLFRNGFLNLFFSSQKSATTFVSCCTVSQTYHRTMNFILHHCFQDHICSGLHGAIF